MTAAEHAKKEVPDYKERFERLAKYYALDLTEAHKERDEARREAIRWQDAWMNETPLHAMGSTVMPWMRRGESN